MTSRDVTDEANLADLERAVATTAPSDKPLVVITGAGVSLASGIPTFRGTDPDAVWARDVTDLGTHRYFREDPAGSWKWYLSRFGVLNGKAPNAGHTAISALERWQRGRGGAFTLITQNVDTLHEQAGSRTLYKVHGTADRVRCSADDGCEFGAPKGSLPRDPSAFAAFEAEPVTANLPRCPACDKPLRPHLLWFDEFYTDHVDYQFGKALWAVKHASLLLFVGTSFSVAITGLALGQMRGSAAPIFAIDPAHAPPSPVRWVRGNGESVLPALVAALPA